MSEIRVGFAMCGSFCTYAKTFAALETLLDTFPNIQPIMSEVSTVTDSRFGTAEEHIRRLETLTGGTLIRTIAQAEPIGPKKLLDVLVIAPCTGNTMAKIARGVTDSCVTMAAKAQLRNRRPVVLALASNDALSSNAENLGRLLCRPNVYFVPLYQDDPWGKPDSLNPDLSRLTETVQAALQGEQLQPILTVKN